MIHVLANMPRAANDTLTTTSREFSLAVTTAGHENDGRRQFLRVDQWLEVLVFSYFSSYFFLLNT